ncbi:MAG: hypothetical protein M0C28_23650 [Candidatus Moduliflexus flocculans]|nr:hypothetical protein [Candidatus Moduliflexus flocculans]
MENRTRELKEANEGLRRMAETDGLTGIANRRRFEAALAEERRRAARTGTVLPSGCSTRTTSRPTTIPTATWRGTSVSRR